MACPGRDLVGLNLTSFDCYKGRITAVHPARWRISMKTEGLDQRTRRNRHPRLQVSAAHRAVCAWSSAPTGPAQSKFLGKNKVKEGRQGQHPPLHFPRLEI